MIDPAFRNINMLFVLSFKLGRNMATGNTFNKHYTPLVETKNLNAFIYNKSFW